jgi:hypothetical protein
MICPTNQWNTKTKTTLNTVPAVVYSLKLAANLGQYSLFASIFPVAYFFQAEEKNFC